MPFGIVSCIVSATGDLTHLATALRSIEHQSYRSFEVLVVADEARRAAAVSAFTACPRARFVQTETSGGGSARNVGALAGQGRWLAFLDGDDLWHREKLARQLAALDQLPHHGFVLAHVRRFWGPDVPASVRLREAAVTTDAERGAVGSTLLVRRSSFELVGPFPDLPDDVAGPEWCRRADRLGVPHLVLPDVLALRRLHAANLDASLGEAGRAAVVARARRLVEGKRGGAPRRGRAAR